ncbi:hypothetical protein [Leuconostoc lactis]|uniref:DinB/UmuC family translesion DNA polymerase n=1 Tax=Leuconostoc lactis TaxID=1246 RepID=UPI001FA9A58C|nr:hypothetical protein [Leuconostoc lactis]
MADLAHANPFRLRKVFGPQNGLRLYALAWGVDRTLIREKVVPASQSLGNSQILPRPYTDINDIRIVLQEIVAQVATRLRQQHLLAGTISIQINSFTMRQQWQQTQRLATSTNITQILQRHAAALLTQHWQSGVAQQLAVCFGELSSDTVMQLDLFNTPATLAKQQQLDQAIDQIRQRFGLTKLVYGASLDAAATAISRANLVGGHQGGQVND